jgi:gingipain R
MKRLNQLIILIAIIFLTAYGGWVNLGGGEEGKAPDITLLSDDASGCRFRVTLYGFYLDTMNIPEGQFSRISLPVSTYRMEKGNPELPWLGASLIIPDYGNVKCEMLNEDMVEMLHILPVIPSKGSLFREDNPDTVPYTFNEIYRNGQLYPNSTFEMQEPFVIYDYRGITVSLNVFRHNPTQGMLEIARNFEVVLQYNNPQFVFRDSISGNFLSAYEKLFLNFSETHYSSLRRKKLIIISHDDFLTEANKLRFWKMKKGIYTEVWPVSQVGGQNPNEIKNFIFGQWNGSPYDLMVILIGDSIHIPSLREEDPRTPGLTYLADPLYVQLTSDPYPDALISRISGMTNFDIQNQINKIIDYEKLNPSLSSRPFDWTAKALVMASSYSFTLMPFTDKDHKLHISNVPTFLQRYNRGLTRLWDENAYPSYILNVLNVGEGLVNFIGYGDYQGWLFSSAGGYYLVFNTAWVNELSNDNKPPFILSVADFVGQFSQNCLAEAFMYRPNNEGAVAFYGSTGPVPRTEPIWADSVSIRSLTEIWSSGDIYPNTAGAIISFGGIEMIYRYPSPNYGSFTFNTWHIFGDASMQIREGQQDSVRVCYEGAVHPDQHFLVKVLSRPYRSEQSPLPCQNAVVCIWKEDINYHVYVLTDANGNAEFIAPHSYGRMELTVTKYNMSSYEGFIMVTDMEPPSRGEQSTDIKLLNSYLSLNILPSISGKTFRIRIPYYASSVDIYNRAGKLVKSMAADKSVFIWNGIDETGKTLSQGVYFVKASSASKMEMKKILLIR